MKSELETNTLDTFVTVKKIIESQTSDKEKIVRIMCLLDEEKAKSRAFMRVYGKSLESKFRIFGHA